MQELSNATPIQTFENIGNLDTKDIEKALNVVKPNQNNLELSPLNRNSDDLTIQPDINQESFPIFEKSKSCIVQHMQELNIELQPLTSLSEINIIGSYPNNSYNISNISNSIPFMSGRMSDNSDKQSAINALPKPVHNTPSYEFHTGIAPINEIKQKEELVLIIERVKSMKTFFCNNKNNSTGFDPALFEYLNKAITEVNESFIEYNPNDPLSYVFTLSRMTNILMDISSYLFIQPESTYIDKNVS